MLNIARNTFREIARNRYLYMIVFFSFVFIIFSILLSQLTIGDTNKIIIDFGLAMIEIFGIIGVLFVGSQLLFKEIDGKTIFLVLSKPIQRYEFIIGKFLGFSLAIFCIILLEAMVFMLLLWYKNIGIDYLIIWSIINTFLKLEILLSIVFFLSSFMGNLITITLSVMIYFLGHSFSIILDIANKTGNNLFINATKVIGIIFPPLEALNTKDIIGYFSHLSLSYLSMNIVYAFLYIFVIIFFTVIIFNKKKFEN